MVKSIAALRASATKKATKKPIKPSKKQVVVDESEEDAESESGVSEEDEEESSDGEEECSEGTDSGSESEDAPPVAKAPEKLEPVIEALEGVYTDIDGFAIARKHRSDVRAQGVYDGTESLQYGEVTSSAFATLLKEQVPKHVKTSGGKKRLSFVDCGAGTGKATLAAATTGIFTECGGVEIVPSLAQAADKALAAARKTKGVLADAIKAVTVTNVEGSCLDFSQKQKVAGMWAAADVFFAPVTCFEHELLEQLVQSMLDRLPEGCLVITTSTITRVDQMTKKMESKRGKEYSLKFLEECRLRYGKGTMAFFLFRLNKKSGEKKLSVVKQMRADRAAAEAAAKAGK